MPDDACTIGSRRYAFRSLKELMARATPLRSGDVLAGIAAGSQEERVAAQMVLADVPLQRFLDELLIPYEQDEVSRLIIDGHNAAAFAPVADLTVGQFREWLLDYETTGEMLTALSPGLTPEMVEPSEPPRERGADWPEAPASRPRWSRPSARSCGTRT